MRNVQKNQTRHKFQLSSVNKGKVYSQSQSSNWCTSISSVSNESHIQQKNNRQRTIDSQLKQNYRKKDKVQIKSTTNKQSESKKQKRDILNDFAQSNPQMQKLVATILVGCFVGFGIGYGGYRFLHSLNSSNTVNSGSSKFDTSANNENPLRFNDYSNPSNGEGRRVNVNSGVCGKLHDSVNIYQKRNIKELNETYSPIGRIVGGSVAKMYHYPWQPQPNKKLQLNSNTSAFLRLIQVSLWVKGGHTCGGSVIASNWILFAAHCTTPYPRSSDWSVYAGNDYQNLMRGSAQYARVEKVIVHYLFDQDTFDHDIALLKLDRDLSFNINVNSICLPQSPQHLIINDICKISGWGAKREGSGTTNALLATSVRVIDKSVCNSEDWLFGLVTQHMFCAGSEDGLTDACQGDSGSPLSCYVENSEKSFLVGVVSWGIGCGLPKTPGVYTHVGLYYNWVMDHIGRY